MSGTRFSFGDITLDLAAGRVQRQGREVVLEPRAFDVLAHLIKRPGEVVSRDAIMDAVWKDVHVGPHSLTQVILQLRHAFDDDASQPRFIETVHRRGYRFIARVTEAPAGEPMGGRPRFPARTVALIGRDALLHDLVALVSDVRLLSLTGPGGVGKTQLALELARSIEPGFDDARLVILSALEGDAEVNRQIALGFDAADAAPGELIARVAATVGGRRVLLVLDNCERLADACRRSIEALLERCPQLRVVATTQRALRARGETVVPVLPLELPIVDSSGRASDPIALARNPAVQLFVRRAREVDAGFSLKPENALAVIEICRRLDGLPLAIELAAARVRVLSTQQIARRLEDRFRLLARGHSTEPPRHETLLATLAWSASLLDADEEDLLLKLAVFNGGWTLDAAAAVASSSDDAVVDLLHGLVDKSFVVADTGATEARYRLLETVRLYARARLDDLPIASEVRTRHLDFFTRRAESAAPEMLGPQRDAASRFFESEAANLREALSWGLQAPTTIETVLRLAVAMRWYWLERGLFAEGCDWLDRGIGLAEGCSPTVMARTHGAFGLFAHHIGEFSRAKVSLRLCLDSLPADDIRERAFASGILAFVEAVAGDKRCAEERAADALASATEAADDWLRGYALLAAGVLQGVSANPLAAADTLDRACAHLARSREPFMLTYVRVNLGLQCYLAGVLDRARHAFVESLRVAQRLGNIRAVAGCLEGLAYLAVSEGDAAMGARLMGAASRIRALTRGPLLPQWQAAHDHNTAAIDSQLGRGLADIERATGAELTVDDLIDSVLSDPRSRQAPGTCG